MHSRKDKVYPNFSLRFPLFIFGYQSLQQQSCQGKIKCAIVDTRLEYGKQKYRRIFVFCRLARGGLCAEIETANNRSIMVVAPIARTYTYVYVQVCTYVRRALISTKSIRDVSVGNAFRT